MKTTLKVYVDCQLFQTPVWTRGMGRYTVSLLKALCTMDESVHYTFVFSSNLPQEPEVLEAVQALCPRGDIVSLGLRTTDKLSYKEASEYNKRLLQDYLASQDLPDGLRVAYFVPCLFQEPTAIVFPAGVEKCLVYYDAIPLLYYHRYKGAINYENYMQRHPELFAADKIFTISQTIADDLALYYGMKVDGKRVVNIDGACIEGMFDEFREPRKKLPEKYILLNTSNDVRKNNVSAVRAFSHVRELTGKNYKMVLTSWFPKEQKDELRALSDNLIFTDTVDDAELAWLYKNAEVIFTASEYEGLGLPILEAVRMGKRVVCSAIPVFREISEEAFYYCDPLDVQDMTVALYDALQGKDWPQKRSLYKAIDQKYTWERSARIVYDAMITPLSSEELERRLMKKPRVAILAPHPAGYSAIGKVVQELHAAASKHFDIDYYFENRKEKAQVDIRPNYVAELAPCYDAADFNALTYREYDAVIYHIGNSEYCFYTILNALYLPGIAVFHDTNLTEAFGEMVRQGFMLPGRMEAEAQLNALSNAKNAVFVGSLLNNQIFALVHSDYAQKALKPLLLKDTKVVRGELPVALPVQNVQLQRREAVHVGLAGILGGRKGLDIIKELALDERIADKVVLHVFGFSVVDPEAVEEMCQYKNVRLTTNLSDLDYQMQLANLDILINYRSSYRGETSLGVLEAGRYGCNVIANRLGWFNELPDDAIVKVDEPGEIIDAVERLVASKSNRGSIGETMKKYIGETHDQDVYAGILAELVNACPTSPSSRRVQAIKSSKNVEQVLRTYKKIQKQEDSHE